MNFFNLISIFVFANVLVACNLKESFNPNDPKNICGGTSSSELAPTLVDTLIEKSVLLNGYIEFDLKVKVRNCTIDDLTNLDISFIGANNTSEVSALTPQISTLGRNELSDFVNVGRYKITTDKLTSDTFNFSLQSESNSWNESISASYNTIKPSFKVVAKDLSISSGSKFSDGDKSLDPGENFSFYFELKNLSITDISDVNVTISSSNNNFVLNSGNSITLGSLTQSQVLTSPGQTQVSISANAIKGTNFNLNVSIVDGFSQTWDSTLPFQISSDGAARISVQTLDLNSGMEFAGFNTYQGNWFIFVQTSTGLNFYKKEPHSSSWNLECSSLILGQYRNLAVDAEFYYIGKYAGIEKISRSNCAFVSSFSPKSISSYSDRFNSISYANGNETFNLSQNNGVLHYRGNSDDFRHISSSLAGSITYYTFENLNPSETMFSSTIDSSNTGYIFGLQYLSFQKYKLHYWIKTISDNSYLHGIDLPTSTYPDLLNTKTFTRLSDGSEKDLIFATQSDNGGTITFYPLYYFNKYPDYCDPSWPNCFYHTKFIVSPSKLKTNL